MFSEKFAILITDINYGDHLDHISLLRYLHETRVRFLKSIGCSEINIDGENNKLIVSNLTCNYKSECFYGDVINVSLKIFKKSDYRLIFSYEIYKKDRIAALSEITTAFIDPNRKLIKVPENLLKYVVTENQVWGKVEEVVCLTN